jgi:hypothetical protein
MERQMAVSGNREAQGSRRARQQGRRCHRVEFSLTAGEFAALQDAAGRAGLARGAYAAQVVLGHVNGSDSGPQAPDREALRELVRAAGLAHKIGVLLNQAVAKLNATGQRPGELEECARICLRRVVNMDAAAEEVRKTIR